MALSTKVLLYSIANASFGGTQIVGANSAVIKDTWRRLRRNSDGIGGLAATVNNVFDISATVNALGVSQLETLMDVGGALASAGTLVVSGINASDGTRQSHSFARAVLTRINISASQEAYATMNLDFMVRAASASDSIDDEHVINTAAVAVAAPSAKAAYRIKSAVFGSETIPCVQALTLNITGKVIQQICGDEKGISTLIIPEWTISGTLTYPDFQKESTTGLASPVYLEGLTRADLALQFVNEGGYNATASTTTITIKNVEFFDSNLNLQAGEVGSSTLGFEALFVDTSNNIVTLDNMVAVTTA